MMIKASRDERNAVVRIPEPSAQWQPLLDLPEVVDAGNLPAVAGVGIRPEAPTASFGLNLFHAGPQFPGLWAFGEECAHCIPFRHDLRVRLSKQQKNARCPKRHKEHPQSWSFKY
jgi:hypothetical protein